MLYQKELGSSPLTEVLQFFEAPEDDLDEEGAEADAEANEEPQGEPADAEELASSMEYARQLVSGTVEKGEEIDERIRRHAENWRLERMPAIDRNILRLAIYEMLYQPKVPRIVIVDEAIELAKKFGSEHSSRFINGLLDGVLKSERAGSQVESGNPD